MPKPRFLLIQARDSDDPMAEHERACMRRRLGLETHLEVRNGLGADVSAKWLDGVDALIVGGSGDYSVHHPESEPWVSRLRRVLDRALTDNLPGFGICFGHQLLGYHLGAPVQTDTTRAEVGTIDVDLTEAGRSDPLFSTVEATFPVHTGHSDHVASLPPELELLATSTALATQAFRLRGTRFYTTQFHPDLTGAEAVARYSAFAAQRPEALHNLARFKPGRDAAVSLLTRFVTLVADDE